MDARCIAALSCELIKKGLPTDVVLLIAEHASEHLRSTKIASWTTYVRSDNSACSCKVQECSAFITRFGAKGVAKFYPDPKNVFRSFPDNESIIERNATCLKCGWWYCSNHRDDNLIPRDQSGYMICRHACASLKVP